MKFFLSIFLVLGIVSSQSALADQTLPNYAARVSQKIESNLRQCGLNLIDPMTPGLPYPRRDATYAVTNRFGVALAYYVQSFGPFADWRWMNPNGSYGHSIQFSNSNLKFVTPYQGNVASSSRFMTPAGIGYNLYCRRFGNVYNWQMFDQCVLQDFVQVVTNQLCSHVNG